MIENKHIAGKTVVGLTGGLASGKDAAAKFFAARGVNIIDADIVSRNLTKDGTYAARQIIRRFGRQVARDGRDDALDRGRLRKLVFADAQALRWLEQLLHPLIRQRIHKRIANNKSPYCLLVVPLMFEGNLSKLCNGGVIVVDVPEEVQLARACRRAGITPELARRIMGRQLARAERVKRADYLMDNNGTLEQLEQRVEQLHMQLLRQNGNPFLSYRLLMWELEDLTPENNIYLKGARVLSELGSKYNFVYDKENPDFIIVHSNFGRNFAYKTIRGLRKKHGFAPYIILCSQEAPVSSAGIADFGFTYQPPSAANFWSPQYAMPPYNLETQDFNDLLQSQPPRYVGRPGKLHKNLKDRFCNFVFRHYRRRLPLTKARVDFCRQLSLYKKVDCAGALLNNTDELKTKFADDKLDYISRYKFTIAFENQRQDYYVTEKILECFIAGSIPIYYGAPNVAEFFNPAAFVNVADYGSFAAALERVQQIDQDAELYRQYRSAPPLLPDSPIHQLSWDKVLGKWDGLFSDLVQAKQDGGARAAARAGTPAARRALLRWRLANYDQELRALLPQLTGRP